MERTGEEYREECSTKQPQDQEDLGAHVLKISIFMRFVCPQMKTPRHECDHENDDGACVEGGGHCGDLTQ